MCKLTYKRLAAFVERRLERTVHQTKPVAIHPHLVFGIYGRDRVFTILNRSDSGLKNDICDIPRRETAHRVSRVRQNFHMQAVISQQKRIGIVFFFVANKLITILQPDNLPADKCRSQSILFHVIPLNFGVAGMVQRRGAIQKSTSVLNDCVAALAIV